MRWFLLILGSVCCILASSLMAATYGGGSGTPDDPYQIWTPQQMNTIGANSSDWDKSFKLMIDIDMSAYTGTQYNIIGTSSKLFAGTFDGNNHKISNLTYTTTSSVDYVGLIGNTSDYAVMKNLGVENISISSGGMFIGGLAGQNRGSIAGCHTTGSVNGRSLIGGLVGINSGLIASSYATASVTGTDFTVGGLVGDNYSGMLSFCYATGSVISGTEVGGLVGNNNGLISFCYAIGSVSGISNHAYIGGLVGRNDSNTLSSCYASGSVSGMGEGACVGGLVGENYYGTLTDCYSTGPVTGAGLRLGGLVGVNVSGSTINSFWDIQTSNQTTSAGGTGKTTSQMKTLATFIDAGWDFIDESENGFHDYWQMQANDYPHFDLHNWTLAGKGTSANPYIVASVADLGKVCLRPLAFYSLAGNLDLTGIAWSSLVVPAFAGSFDGRGYVISNLTINQSNSDSIGLFGTVYGRGNIENLGIESPNLTGRSIVGGLVGTNFGSISSCYTAGSISLTAEYLAGGLVGHNWGILTECYTTGSVFSTGQTVGGLVGINYGLLTTCHVTSMVRAYSRVGGLVGGNSDSITSCYATGSVTATNGSAGGLVGSNYIYSSITSCYASGSVSGNNDVGGLVGKNYGGLVTSCYATGSVGGSSYVGGLVGENIDEGLIQFSYACGTVIGKYSYIGGLVGDNDEGSIDGCIWNTQTSGRMTSAGGTGKTSAQMRTLSIFTSAGWDFTNETANGTADFWRMCIEGVDYPRLNWESIRGDFACPDGVNTEDLDYYVARWLVNKCTSANNFCGGADINFSGSVDLADYSILVENWMRQ